MLKKMQRRFILAAMAAFGTVMLLVAAGINLVNYMQSTAMQDDMADRLLGYERQAFKQPGAPFPPMEDMPGGGPEARFTTRFFVVHCDSGGEARFVSRDFISSVSDREAGEYAAAVLAEGKERGYYDDYRYLVRRDGAGSIVLFLNASHSLHNMRSLFLVSVGTGLISLVVVFGLVVFFSRYAIRPYVKNIERQKRFITDAGHELKTPITSIAASADIAAMEHEGDEWIDDIRKQTGRLSRLVGDLVALSRLDEETPFPEKGTFSLSEAVWETAEPFAVLAKARGKEYSQRVEEGLTFHGDRASIQRMLSILLDNAVKYSTGEIRLDVCRRRSRICIEVYNTCEIADISELDRFFDRFYRGDQARSSHSGSTGIGLSMAQAIAETHGGRIGVKSEGGKNIRFRVIL